ncbi:S-layer homology domain-containing protein, partial [Candidatus Peregrinibacteria bacterium]|nr:S-layer homology domain-containing protein [Candidatus Peregrinibacteria bacterium]
NTINRAEFTKLLIEAAYDDEFESYGEETCFDDVPAGEWYTKYVCFANDMDIVEGYDGGGFHPDAVINFAEASKIVVLAYDYDTQDDSPWYKPYVDVLSDEFAIPSTIDSFDQEITRGDMSEMIYRLLSDLMKPYETYDHILDSSYTGPDFDEVSEVVAAYTSLTLQEPIDEDTALEYLSDPWSGALSYGYLNSYPDDFELTEVWPYDSYATVSVSGVWNSSCTSIDWLFELEKSNGEWLITTLTYMDYEYDLDHGCEFAETVYVGQVVDHFLDATMQEPIDYGEAYSYLTSSGQAQYGTDYANYVDSYGSTAYPNSTSVHTIDIDNDDAIAYVNGDYGSCYEYEWIFELELINGEWKIDEFAQEGEVIDQCEDDDALRVWERVAEFVELTLEEPVDYEDAYEYLTSSAQSNFGVDSSNYLDAYATQNYPQSFDVESVTEDDDEATVEIIGDYGVCDMSWIFEMELNGDNWEIADFYHEYTMCE